MGTPKFGVKARPTKPLRLAGHPDAPSLEEWRSWVLRSTQPIAVDLFSGAGGLSCGLEAAGFRVVLSVDSDEWALESHAHNFPALALGLDLAAEESRDEVVELFDGIEVDLIAAGPPCQPFSRAGRSKIRSLVNLGLRDSVDMRKELWRAFLDVVERVRPRAVLMENVPDMALADDMIVLRAMIDQLEDAGYAVDARIVDSWVYGVPQHRQRLLVVGVPTGTVFEWPDPVEQVTVRDAIGDLPVLDVSPDTPIGSEVMPYQGSDISDFARSARNGGYADDEPGVVHDHVTRAVREDDHNAFELMTSDMLYSDLPEAVKRYRDDIFDDKYNRLDWSGLSRSITAHIARDGYWYIHPEQHRTLTVREAARIQTFPDSFRFAGSRSRQFQQIGNAVPPALAEVVGSAVLDSLSGKSNSGGSRLPERSLFRERLGRWAAEDAIEAPWAYPGDDPWPVAVGLIVGRGAAWPRADDVLGLVPTIEGADLEVFKKIEEGTRSEARRKVAKRIAGVAASVRDSPDGWETDRWSWGAGFGPAAHAWYSVLTKESEQLVASAPVLRVTARVTGTNVDRRRQRSAGRLELAKLIGGENGAKLNAAMHRLGQKICTPNEPMCYGCPVRAVCIGAVD